MKETLSHVSAAPFIQSYPSFAQYYQSYASDPVYGFSKILRKYRNWEINETSKF